MMVNTVETSELFPLFIKIGLLIFLALYIVFSFFVSRQVDLMVKTLEIGLEKLIKNISLFYLLFSLGVFILALLIL